MVGRGGEEGREEERQKDGEGGWVWVLYSISHHTMQIRAESVKKREGSVASWDRASSPQARGMWGKTGMKHLPGIERAQKGQNHLQS